MSCWAQRIAFPLKGRSSAGHPGQSRDRAWEGKREDGEEDTGPPCRRPHAAVGAKGGGRHQEPYPFLALLHDAADGEGPCRKNRPRQSDVAQTGVQASMSYCINRAVSISSIFFLPPAFRSLFGLWRMLFFLECENVCKYTKFRRIVFWAVPCFQVPAPPFFRDDFFLFFSLAFENPNRYHPPRSPKMGCRETSGDL